ncbi:MULTISPECIES: hypothetical protein [unclassified Sporosarcina]|uniref:hypothetical protein n=1 Tax=unclassified Sporosarcina TaxID=2647733 RepID=UPI000C16E272|nr:MULTISPECIES: hypothetical protein [unclassified Sporosarcina]PID06449.1 hypothetical protein CSV66_03910 [Sporosarcina sp. P30]PID09643.1 hypothetical protein CSV65_03910 [Sporosarcina sp. P31]PID13221.1 hypothetical protein CSV64_01945 [Sporosarcina sp. P32b]
MKVKATLIILVTFASLFGITACVFYNKISVYEAGMENGIQDMLRDSALFFENEEYEKDYVAPLYTLYGYTEVQYNYMRMTTDSEMYTVARIVKEFVDPDLYAQLSAEQKSKTAQYLRQLANDEPIDFERELLPFLNELSVK